VPPVEVDPLTLILLIVSAILGAWLGAGVVSSWPRRKIQLGMGFCLAAAAIIMLVRLTVFHRESGHTARDRDEAPCPAENPRDVRFAIQRGMDLSDLPLDTLQSFNRLIQQPHDLFGIGRFIRQLLIKRRQIRDCFG